VPDVTSSVGSDVTVLDSTTDRVTPVYGPSESCDNKAAIANRKFTCRYAWNPKVDSGVDHSQFTGETLEMRRHRRQFFDEQTTIVLPSNSELLRYLNVPMMKQCPCHR